MSTRIAFGSCTRRQADPEQAVWKHVRDRKPDRLLLLGDQIYMDFGLPQFGGNLYEPRRWSFDDFVRTMHGHYKAQFCVPAFQGLLQALPAGHAYCIWDDHDFAWNNAVGGAGRREAPGSGRQASRIEGTPAAVSGRPGRSFSSVSGHAYLA